MRLFGVLRSRGFLPWAATVQLGMLYDDFVALLEKCKTELEGTHYYIVHSRNCYQFDKVYVRLQKRSGVVLARGRRLIRSITITSLTSSPFFTPVVLRKKFEPCTTDSFTITNSYRLASSRLICSNSLGCHG